MEKILTIDGRDVGFRANALTPRLYRHHTGRDVIRDLNELKKAFTRAVEAQHLQEPGKDASESERAAYQKQLQEAQLDATNLEIFEDVAWIMARQYDKNVPATPDDWLEEFETFSIYEILPEVLQLWLSNQQTTAVPYSKKK